MHGYTKVAFGTGIILLALLALNIAFGFLPTRAVLSLCLMASIVVLLVFPLFFCDIGDMLNMLLVLTALGVFVAIVLGITKDPYYALAGLPVFIAAIYVLVIGHLTVDKSGRRRRS